MIDMDDKEENVKELGKKILALFADEGASPEDGTSAVFFAAAISMTALATQLKKPREDGHEMLELLFQGVRNYFDEHIESLTEYLEQRCTEDEKKLQELEDDDASEATAPDPTSPWGRH